MPAEGSRQSAVALQLLDSFGCWDRLSHPWSAQIRAAVTLPQVRVFDVETQLRHVDKQKERVHDGSGQEKLLFDRVLWARYYVPDSLLLFRVRQMVVLLREAKGFPPCWLKNVLSDVLIVRLPFVLPTELRLPFHANRRAKCPSQW